MTQTFNGKFLKEKLAEHMGGRGVQERERNCTDCIIPIYSVHIFRIFVL